MRVLLVTSRHPVPPWRGNQVRTTEWLKALEDLELLLVCPAPGKTDGRESPVREAHFPVSPLRRGVGLLRSAVVGRPLQEGLYDSKPALGAVAEAMGTFSPDVVVIQMVRCAWAAEVARTAAPDAAVVFDAIDAMGLHFDRAAASSAMWLSPLLRGEAGRCRRRERWLSRSAELTVAVAARDLAELSVPEGRGRVIPVAGRETPTDTTHLPGKVVLLSGNLGYRPTVEGALWFARAVWPLVRRSEPDARWILAGARPAAAIRRLSELDGVEVHADVPDLASYLAAARVAVAPMSSGSGVPMKVLEAMAAGVPAVVHPWAAEGLAKDAVSAVAVADGAGQWTATVTGLLADANAARDLGDVGLHAWRRHYHPDVVAQQIRDVVSEAASLRAVPERMPGTPTRQ